MPAEASDIEFRSASSVNPDPDKERAIRASRKAGFRPAAHLKDRFAKVLIMQHETDKNELN